MQSVIEEATGQKGTDGGNIGNSKRPVTFGLDNHVTARDRAQGGVHRDIALGASAHDVLAHSQAQVIALLIDQ